MSQIDTILEYLQALDGDSMTQEQGPLPSPPRFGLVMRYEILEKDVPFAVNYDPQTNRGILVNTRPLDFEVDKCRFNFTVLAYDGGNLSSSSPASVQVRILNSNDNGISFKNNSYQFHLHENHVGNVGTLSVSDIDLISALNCHPNQSAMLPGVTLSLFGQNVRDDVFSIDSRTGEIFTTKALDYESQLQKELQLVASANDGYHSAISSVSVALIDVDEYCPSVSSSPISLSVPENSNVGFVIFRLLATDADGTQDGRGAEFEVVNSTLPLPFSVSPKGEVAVASELDYESNQTLYSVYIRVFDNSERCQEGSLIAMQVSITNENDETPYFMQTEYTFLVSELSPLQSVIGELRAFDPDMPLQDHLQFSLDTDQVPFNVTSTGEVVLLRSLDFETEEMYMFSVSVSDGLHTAPESALVKVKVQNINEHSPEFLGPFIFVLPENEIIRFKVNVIDRDGSEMGIVHRFALKDQQDYNIFAIDHQGYITNNESLDYENIVTSMIQLTVCAYDVEEKESCELFSMTVQDRNDNAPQFSQESYSVEVMEGREAGDLVRVSAVDQDRTLAFREVMYSWDDKSEALARQHQFSIDQQNGSIFSSKRFDYESDPTSIELIVKASDNRGMSSSARLLVSILDLNEFSPQFAQSRYNISVAENHPLSLPFYTFAGIDQDGGALFGSVQRYMLTHSYDSQNFPFQLETNGSLVTKKRLDFESGMIEFSFSVVAIDGGGLESDDTPVTVHILDAQDSPPRFEPSDYHVLIRENSDPLTVNPLAEIRVVTESPSVTFETIPSEYSNQFKVNATGFVKVLAPLDFEMVQRITLEIRAFDGSLYSPSPASLHVSIQPENDNVPVFTKQYLEVSIEENSLPNSLEVILEAVDSDLDLLETRHGVIAEYRLLNASIPFALHRNGSQGSVLLSNTRPLDAEVDPSRYTLAVQAFDGAGVSAVQPVIIIVDIEDVDESRPFFSQISYSFMLPENYVGFIGNVELVDLDRDADLGTLQYALRGRQSTNFTVFGNGSIINPAPFDYEVNEDTFLFMVTVSGCADCTANISIHLEDTNDHEPKFTTAAYSFMILPNVFPSVGHVIGQVVATDGDKSVRFGRIAKYEVIGDANPFSLHSKSGDITISDPTELTKSQRVVSFEVTATDRGGLSTRAKVDISIPIFNLYPPVFEQRFYYLTWNENLFNFRLPGLPVNSLLQVSAQDLDHPFSTITYHLTSEHAQFNILEDGFLMLNAPLDWEEAAEHTLNVRAFDGVYNSTFDTQIRIMVLNQNDNPPVLEQTLYVVNVSEYYRTFSTPITRILASDQDSSSIQLSYTILEQRAPFRVNFQGYVYLLMQLDYELNTMYEFNVMVSDGAHQADSLARVMVSLIDENDHYPFFSQPSYQATLRENSPAGSLSLSISALDFDASSQYGTVTNYSILENGIPFRIQYNILSQPYLTNSAPLDYETDHHVYVFHIHAYDAGGLRSFFPAQVIINLLDTDDCSPAFLRSSFSYTLAENIPTPSFITKLSTTDCDLSPQYRRVEFSIRNSRGLISIHPTSGTLMALRSFDYEATLQPYIFEVIARSPVNFTLYDRAVLNLTISDTNEHSPHFINAPYQLTIPEDTKVRTVLFTVQATDNDRGPLYGSISRYLIQQFSRSSNLPFSLDPSTGELSLREALNYDTGTIRYTIPVIAFDGGMLFGTTTVEVLVSNVEDEAPYFITTEYTINIEENLFNFQKPGLPSNALVQIEARNGDRSDTSLIYTFADMRHFTLFSLDAAGYLYLRQSLDFEREEEYSLEISVRNSVYMSNQTASVRVIVTNINDEAPIFYQCLDGCCGDQVLSGPIDISISENLLPQLPILNFSACDSDSSNLQYTLNGSSAFRISEGGHLMVVASLDFEEQTMLNLMVAATDGSFSSQNMLHIIVHVDNVDDNDLVFTKDLYEVVINENMEAGSMNLTISAADRDNLGASIVYSLPDEDFALPFRLQQQHSTGSSIITNKQSFDYEDNQEWFIFNVSAHTNSTSSLVSQEALSVVYVQVTDINEYTPQFSNDSYKGSINENEVGIMAKVSAVDRDGGSVYGTVHYSLVSEVHVLCTVTPQGDVVTMEPFDAEHMPEVIEMQVEARDGGGLHSIANITVTILDQNDYHPYFSPRNYYTSIDEDIAINSIVLTLNAKDKDRSERYNKIMDYRVLNSVQNVPFIIFSNGSIAVTQSIDYDIGPRVYVFEVLAVDSGNLSSNLPARVTVEVLNVPDRPPVFEQTLYMSSVLENAQRGTLVTHVHARSVDGGDVDCILSDSSATLPFSIGTRSGIIRVNGSIDYEQKRLYEFDVKCYLSLNTNISASTNIRIDVVNTNDHSPVLDQEEYTVSLMENSPRGSLEITVSASDGDLGNAGEIQEFQIYSKNGGFYVKDFNQASATAVISNLESFDYEVTKRISFSIRCIDRGRPPRLSELHNVTVDIIDDNDNLPKLSRHFYASSISENSFGTVLTVHATDEDDGILSGQVTSFSIRSAVSVPFNITPEGVIEVADVIDYEAFTSTEIPRFEFSVIAMDGYGLESVPARVFVTIRNENDNPPEAVYSSEWPLKSVDVEWGTQVSLDPLFTLRAQDKDRQDSLYYTINGISFSLPFALPNSMSGDIILQQPLTILRTYNFTVTVQDRVPHFSLPETNSILWYISVNVIDTNSPPFFSPDQLVRVLTFQEDTSFPQHPILILLALDNDYPNTLFSTIVSFSIVHQNLPGSIGVSSNVSNFPFEITNTGQLFQVSPLDAFVRSQYVFSVIATDGGGLTTLDPVAVTVMVQEVNNFPPVFINAPYETIINHDTNAGVVIYDIEVEDSDKGMSGQVKCSIAGESPLFDIDSGTCGVYLRKSLAVGGLDDGTVRLTIVATDEGSPPFSSNTTFTVTILPSTAYELEIIMNKTSFEFMEEGDPLYLLEELVIDTNYGAFLQHSAAIKLSPSFNKFSPENFESQCLVDGVVVNLTLCVPTAINLLLGSPSNAPVSYISLGRFLPPSAVQTSRSLVFIFQSWIRFSSQTSQVLLSAYSSPSRSNDQLFLIQIQNRMFKFTFTDVGRTRKLYNITLMDEVRLSDGDWHYVFIAILPSKDLRLYVDGKFAGLIEVAEGAMTVPEEFHLFLGRTKANSEPPFSGFFWGSSISFDYQPDQIYSYISCSMSCGESISIKANFSTHNNISFSSFGIVLEAMNLDNMVFFLRQLRYYNLASEPSTDDRSLTIQIANERAEVNGTFLITTKLRNDHRASLDTNIQRNVFYYVAPRSTPRPEAVNDHLIFRDRDTTQNDYKIKIDLVPPLQRSCDRLDYHLKIKLEQCGYRENKNVYNLLPISQWRLATLRSVQLYFRSLLGYYFYGTGVLIPDMNIYRSFTFNPSRFSLTFWIQFSGAGTIVYIRNETENFLLHVHGNKTNFNVTYASGTHTAITYSWPWRARNEWLHIAVNVDRDHIEFCTSGYICRRRDLSLTTGTSDTFFSGFEVYVGALPRERGVGYHDHFLGALNGLGLVSNYSIPMDILSCVVACSEHLTLTTPIPGLSSTLGPLVNPNSTGIKTVDGSLQIRSKLRQDEVQHVLRNVAYINMFPYPLPGTRSINYTIQDGATTLHATTSVVVLFHNYRNLQLLRVGRVTLTNSNLKSGAKIFGSAGISSDPKTNTMDSLLVELSSVPSNTSSCYRSSNSHTCPVLFHLNEQLLEGTDLQMFMRPEMLLITGLGNISYYQTLLHEVSIQIDKINEVISAGSIINIRVYISDQNGISSNIKTATIRVTNSVLRQKRDISDQFEEVITEKKSELAPSNIVVGIIIACSVIFVIFVLFGFYASKMYCG